MRSRSIGIVTSALLLASAVPALANPKVRRGPTAPRVIKTPKPAPRTSSLSIAPERATQIQSALVKAGYLSGSPSGVWDAQTQAAMEKLQSDNGWQTKLVPDSRAIIKLGLGSSTSTGAAFASSSNDADAPGPTPELAAPGVPAVVNK